MFAATPDHSSQSESISTIQHIVLKSSRAHVVQSYGDGFGSYVERLINTAHEAHRSFPSLLQTLNDLINYIHSELERTHYQYQFSIIIGKDFDYDENFSNHFAVIEHTGIKILIFSSIGTSYKSTTTTTINGIDDDKNPLSW
jgi:hypothetical protein